jgi:hypothetical protein
MNINKPTPIHTHTHTHTHDELLLFICKKDIKISRGQNFNLNKILQ